MTNKQHTPTPWEVKSVSDISGLSREVIMSGPQAVAYVYGTGTEKWNDAAFIVRAVNLHEEMVRVLKNARDVFEFEMPSSGSKEATLAALEAAITKAEGE